MDELLTWLAKQLASGNLGVAVVLAVAWAYAEYSRKKDRDDAIANRKIYQEEAQTRIKANESLSRSIDAMALAIARMEGVLSAQRPEYNSSRRQSNNATRTSE